jgi:hypothetical protein
VINDPVETTLASRTMFSSGLVILAFVTYQMPLKLRETPACSHFLRQGPW